MSVLYDITTVYVNNNVRYHYSICQWCVRVIFVESESYALGFRVESESSKIFSSRVRVMTWSSRVTRTVESLRVIGLQARVTRNFTFFQRHFFALKWHPTCYEMAPDKLKNGPNVVLTSSTAGYSYLSSLSLHFACLFHSQSCQKSPAQPFC